MTLPTDYTKLNAKQKAQVRTQYVKLQGGLCFHCNEPLDKPPPLHIREKPLLMRLFPPGFLKHPIHLQHNHDTNMTEGAVHAYCNGVLWQYHGK